MYATTADAIALPETAEHFSGDTSDCASGQILQSMPLHAPLPVLTAALVPAGGSPQMRLQLPNF
jgi:hypothetical protein